MFFGNYFPIQPMENGDFFLVYLYHGLGRLSIIYFLFLEAKHRHK